MCSFEIVERLRAERLATLQFGAILEYTFSFRNAGLSRPVVIIISLADVTGTYHKTNVYFTKSKVYQVSAVV